MECCVKSNTPIVPYSNIPFRLYASKIFLSSLQADFLTTLGQTQKSSYRLPVNVLTRVRPQPATRSKRPLHPKLELILSTIFPYQPTFLRSFETLLLLL